MDSPVRILGIAGSLRKKSYNRAALAAAGQLFPPHTTIDIFVLDGIPGFNEDIEQNPPPIILEFKRQVRAADAILFAKLVARVWQPSVRLTSEGDP